ncbi:hypothetical protein PoB_001275400 [Plakobranchus ocellatus]|uniref:Uncharacterized protein n=1 Tax=Plakobranchus ocellatus TaxID=259542 RepID=A0AAV3YT47_9GAST|nr:hypothetical protein PoB_001275400 [Plakobranchus ocellatus]
MRNIGGRAASESTLRSARTLLSRVRAPPSVPRPDRVPESLKSLCSGLAIYKKIKIYLEKYSQFLQNKKIGPMFLDYSLLSRAPIDLSSRTPFSLVISLRQSKPPRAKMIFIHTFFSCICMLAGKNVMLRQKPTIFLGYQTMSLLSPH